MPITPATTLLLIEAGQYIFDQIRRANAGEISEEEGLKIVAELKSNAQGLSDAINVALAKD